MLVAGIMRQESAFASEAVSYAGAVGLMQVLPKTAPHLARRMKLRYTRARLFDPEYNLDARNALLERSVDAIRYARSRAGRIQRRRRSRDRGKGSENTTTPEFVESIPFTRRATTCRSCFATRDVPCCMPARSAHRFGAHPLASEPFRIGEEKRTRRE